MDFDGDARRERQRARLEAESLRIARKRYQRALEKKLLTDDLPSYDNVMIDTLINEGFSIKRSLDA